MTPSDASSAPTVLPLRKALIPSVCCFIISVAGSAAQTSTELSLRVVEHSEDTTVYQRVTAMTDAAGSVSLQTNQFTLLENCLNYFEDGQWKGSEDVIEVLPDAVVARRGPNKAFFSPDLNSPSVFDIQTSDGKRLRGGVRAVQLTDVATGKSFVLATVKESAPGELLPPNQVVYRDAFVGLKADVLLIWKHNIFSHDLVIREQPKLPAGMNPETTRIEVLTELVEAPQATIRNQSVTVGSSGQLRDDVVIHFGRLAFVMGKAFPVDGSRAWAMGGLTLSQDALPVLKQWHALPDGRTFLVESIGWLDAQPHLMALPVAEEARLQIDTERDVAMARTWPQTPDARKESRPMQVAQIGYQPDGYVMDFVTLPDNPLTTTFVGTETYYVKNNYSTGSTVTFLPGCYIKFKNNAYMLLYGPITFPSAPPHAIFTSRDDDLFGERIQSVAGEANSDSDPTDHLANPAVWIYYVTFITEIKNARFRWAQRGVQYDSNPGVDINHVLRDSLFEQCQTGVYLNLPEGKLTLTSVQRCDVATQIGGSGDVTGQMTVSPACDTPVNSAANDLNNQPDPQQNTQNETAVTVAGGKVIAAWMDTNKGHESLGNITACCFTLYSDGRPTEYCPAVLPQFLAWAVSSDGGQSFVDKGSAPVFQYTDTSGQNVSLGNDGDPVLATYGSIVYLAGNPQRPSTYKPQGATTYRLYLPFWKSTDLGQTFAVPVNIVNVSTPMTGAPTLTSVNQGDVLDKPWLVANPNNGDLYLTMTWLKTAATDTILFFRSLDGGQTWEHREFVDEFVNTDGVTAPFLAIGGTSIYQFWRIGSSGDPTRIRKSTDRGLTFQSPTQNGLIPNSQGVWRADLLRNSHDPTNFATDTFFAPAVFQAAVNPQSGHIYLVYHNRPTGSQDTDIFLQYSTNGGANWTAPVRVNDAQTGDQWQPGLAVRPDGLKLFIGWYDRKHDVLFNHRIRVRGMISTITQQTPLGSPSYFEVSAEDFAPVFTGTKTVDDTFDPVYGGNDATIIYDGQGNPIGVTQSRCGQLIGQMGDYDQAFADSSFIYYCWNDCRVRRSGRLQGDIRFKKISW